MIRNFRRFVAFGAALVLAGCNGWLSFGDSEADAASSSNRANVIAMSNTGPFSQRDDGIGYDLDNKGAGLIVNGEFDQMFNSALYVGIQEDFLGSRVISDVDGADIAQDTWNSQDAATAGCPAIKADYDNGALELLLDNGNEVGDCTLYWGDEQNIDSDTEPFCIFRIQFQTQPAAADKLSWGLMNGRNAIFESVANFAAFTVAGANSDLKVESDDASTDVAPVDSTVDMTAGTFIETMVSLNSMHGRTAADPDGCSPTDACFFYRTSTSSQWTQILPNTTFSVGADAALQPVVQVEKTSGTTTPDLLVDYVKCYWQRE